MRIPHCIELDTVYAFQYIERKCLSGLIIFLKHTLHAAQLS